MSETPFTDLVITKDGILKKGTRNWVEKRQESHERVVKGDIFKKTVAWAKELGFSGRALQEPGGGLVDRAEQDRVNDFVDKIVKGNDNLPADKQVPQEVLKSVLGYIALGKFYIDGMRMHEANPDAFKTPHDFDEQVDRAKFNRALIAEVVYKNTLRDPFSGAEVAYDREISVEIQPETHFPGRDPDVMRQVLTHMGAQQKENVTTYPARTFALTTSLDNAVRQVAFAYSYPSPHQK